MSCTLASLAIASITFEVKAQTTVTVCDTYANTAGVSGSNFPASQASATVVCTKPDPAIAIDKTGPATATAGEGILYTLAVKNTGPTAFPDGAVLLTDALCEAPPVLVSRNGDGTPGFLDPGETWTYTCTVRTVLGQTQVVNVAQVTGTDVNGRSASASDDATTTLSQPPAPQGAVAGVQQARVIRGTAKLRGPTGCAARTVRAVVTGRRIAKVVWTVDGKRTKTLTKADKNGRWTLSLRTRKYRYGTHTVRARVTFVAAAKTKSRTLRMNVIRCRRVVKAAFTG
ncbi:MAG: hypothetical protein H0W37_10570 [Pseudonocardiales bacterium]|nr:hypothetical protein [Pseudonocardiales bacterium]